MYKEMYLLKTNMFKKYKKGFPELKKNRLTKLIKVV